MKNNSKFLPTVIIVFLLMVNYAVIAQRSSPVHKTVEDAGLVLLGKAVKKFLTFRVVTVELYLPPGCHAGQIFEDIPRRLRVRYHVNIPKLELDRATLKGIEKNVSPDELKRLMPKIEQINACYPNVESGDQIIITYTPGVGSSVRVNDEVKGMIAGKDFADAFFAIWVGEHPVDAKAKLQLLGKKPS